MCIANNKHTIVTLKWLKDLAHCARDLSFVSESSA
jgi:hypothetical protein